MLNKIIKFVIGTLERLEHKYVNTNENKVIGHISSHIVSAPLIRASC